MKNILKLLNYIFNKKYIYVEINKIISDYYNTISCVNCSLDEIKNVIDILNLITLKKQKILINKQIAEVNKKNDSELTSLLYNNALDIDKQIKELQKSLDDKKIKILNNQDLYI